MFQWANGITNRRTILILFAGGWVVLTLLLVPRAPYFGNGAIGRAEWSSLWSPPESQRFSRIRTDILVMELLALTVFYGVLYLLAAKKKRESS
jgi:hypothetical protein